MERIHILKQIFRLSTMKNARCPFGDPDRAGRTTGIETNPTLFETFNRRYVPVFPCQSQVLSTF